MPLLSPGTGTPAGSWEQCCLIWQFVANLDTSHVKLLLKYWFGYLSILATLKNLAKNWFWLDPFVLWCRYFSLSRELCIWSFQNCFDVGLLGFTKIWLLFPQTFWQHWLGISSWNHPTPKRQPNLALWFSWLFSTSNGGH